ncbi:MAG: BPSS1780 family membrane protein [Burkholderiaceae bacterium]
MKLNIVPARTGVTWVKQGISTFWRQPLALSGLFFMFLAVMTIVGMVPVLGLALALALLPACSLGLMAASREAETGKFPMPLVFLSAFRAGRAQLRAMLILGVLYGVSFWLIMGVTTLFDGGSFATRYMAGENPTLEMAQNPATQVAMLVFLALQMPLSLMFWHAPALVHWHQVSAVKSVFFSLVACLRNFWAFTVFGLVWLLILLFAILVVTLCAAVLGKPQLVGVALVPVSMMIAAMFFTSTYFTFRDCFDPGTGEITPWNTA